MGIQPSLHRLVTCVRAPAVALFGRDGAMEPGGAQGVYVGDQRVLDRLALTLGGAAPEPVATWLEGPSSARFVALARTVGDPGPDPTVRVTRLVTAHPDGLSEDVTVTSEADSAVRARLELRLEVGLTPVDDVKAGEPGRTQATVEPVVPPATDAAAWTGRRDGDEVRIELTTEDGRVDVDGRTVTVAWDLDLPARSEWHGTWQLAVTDSSGVVRAPTAPAPWSTASLTTADHRLAAFVQRSLDDLDALRLVTVDQPETQFLAAGSPWYMALFGRDSLWAARLMLPFGTELLAGTLEVLARRQGRRTDPTTGEQPGKILHEVRRGAPFPMTRGAAGEASVYYGTVDATALWVSGLHDAWRWGLDPARVAALMPQLEAAMRWLTTDADSDGDGFLEYYDVTGRGLSNQGWKDSHDAIRFRDGRLASGAIALVEVQGYAYAAASAAAELAEAFGRPQAEEWTAWAAALAGRFRERFWVEDPTGRYPALALDGDKRAVDSLTSNIGHLLGTGILDATEARTVADRLTAPDMLSGFGLRTMSTAAGGYNPSSYHCGSVWPHDTAIVALGLHQEGLTDHAVALITALVDAAAATDYRLPELFCGDEASESPALVPYPAACRPQAWSAASAGAAVQILLGASPPPRPGAGGHPPLPQRAAPPR